MARALGGGANSAVLAAGSIAPLVAGNIAPLVEGKDHGAGGSPHFGGHMASSDYGLLSVEPCHSIEFY